jgi:phosphonoacetaldehyde hydrolase
MKDFHFRRTYVGPVKLAIFDWAGTTVDYGCFAPAVSFVELFKSRGVEISMAQARSPMGLGKRDHITAITQFPEVSTAWQSHHGQPITEKDIDEMYIDFQGLQLECLAEYADLIPGTLEAVEALRQRGLRIGATTGYFTEAMDRLLEEAGKRGYVPDSSVCVSQVPAGRPEPWMVMQNMINTGVYPPEAVVKVGDTKPDIGEGLNAGVWTIGVAMTGNEVGLSEEEITALPQAERDRRASRAREALARSGAHYVVDTLVEVLPVIDEIDARLSRGDRP